MVHQEHALLPGFTVGQNIKLGRENILPLAQRLLPKNLALINRTKDYAQASAYLHKLGVNLDPRTRLANLPINLRQYIELAREMSRHDLRVLILDEPTAALGKEDTNNFMLLLEELANQGTAIIFVSHKLEEVMAISRNITILRDGEVVAQLNHDDREFRLDSITLAMLGRETIGTRNKREKSIGPDILKFEDWKVEMPGEIIRSLNLNIKQGEILGITGLTGHGKTALGHGLLGMFPTSGRIMLGEHRLDTSQPYSVIAKGIYFLTDDRRQAGLLLERSILENIIFSAAQHKKRFLKYQMGSLSTIDWNSARKYAVDVTNKLEIHCQNIHQLVGLLSGGNQQKICLARALAFEPRILFASEPTQGIDVGAKQAILEALLNMNQEFGTTIICISSELSDLKQICDRIMVMCEGEIFGEFLPHTEDSEFAMAFSGKRLLRYA
jgi:simple sugar transport system ATP-binding protein